MNYPDWYAAWRRDAFLELMEKNRRLAAEFKIGRWERYDYDLSAGTLKFSRQGVVRVVCEVDVVGTTSNVGGDWLWSWANPSWPKERSVQAELVRAFGRKHGIPELIAERVMEGDWAETATDGCVPVFRWEPGFFQTPPGQSPEGTEDELALNGLGWELAAVMVRITNTLGAYRPPSRNDAGALYLAC
jgi:hypothetical protein